MNAPIRYTPMSEMIRVRSTVADKEQIKEAAAKAGLNVSSFIRHHLIQQGIITP